MYKRVAKIRNGEQKLRVAPSAMLPFKCLYEIGKRQLATTARCLSQEPVNRVVIGLEAFNGRQLLVTQSRYLVHVHSAKHHIRR
jgi:hypothetical protein